MARWVVLTLALGTFAVAGARAQDGGVPPTVQGDDVLARIAKAEALWAARKPAAYEFKIGLVCFCELPQIPPTFRVAKGVSTPVAPLDDRYRQTYSRYDTVEKLFARAREMAAAKPFKFAIEFDAPLGYPTLIQVDGKEQVADDELTIRVTGLRAVKDIK